MSKIARFSRSGAAHARAECEKVDPRKVAPSLVRATTFGAPKVAPKAARMVGLVEAAGANADTNNRGRACVFDAADLGSAFLSFRFVFSRASVASFGTS